MNTTGSKQSAYVQTNFLKECQPVSRVILHTAVPKISFYKHPPGTYCKQKLHYNLGKTFMVLLDKNKLSRIEKNQLSWLLVNF